jgi:hypothetical protein
VSHQTERKEKNCLNCGTMVAGRFCQHCGQENVITHQSFWSMATHFVFDIFHFDGKFFETLGALLSKPGKVAKGYISGKRVSYLDPVRMYLFTSAFFFLIFFAEKTIHIPSERKGNLRLTTSERLKIAHDLFDSTSPEKNDFRSYVVRQMLDSSQVILLLTDSAARRDSVIRFYQENYTMVHKTRAEINRDDSLHQSTWLGRAIQKKARKISDENPDKPGVGTTNLINELLHRIPYMLFISLPFFALILKLIYLGRTQFYYSDHLVFTLYHYIFSFILLLFILLFGFLQSHLGWGIFDWLELILVLYWFFYLYKGMRSFYGESRSKTIAKFFLLNVLGFILLGVLILLFLVLSAIEF